MSLPDTIFIFVLALVIFGPKRLPEIGRQIGKLVGEFRRASNEFKFQIEEELRQADILDKSGSHPTIAAPLVNPAPAAEALQPPVLAEFPAPAEFPPTPAESMTDPSANLPAGQYPNPDTLNLSELKPAEQQPRSRFSSAEPATATTLNITPAEGSQPRSAAPFIAAGPESEANNLPAEERKPPTSESQQSMEPQQSLFESPASAHPDPARAEAEVSHG